MLYKEIVDYIKSKIETHQVVKSVYVGMEPIRTLKDVEYPLIYIFPQDVERYEKYKTYTFELYYCDKKSADEGNLMQILYQGEAVLNDIITFFQFDENLTIEFTQVITPFIDAYDQMLCGQILTLNLLDLKTPINNCETNFN